MINSTKDSVRDDGFVGPPTVRDVRMITRLHRRTRCCAAKNGVRVGGFFLVTSICPLSKRECDSSIHEMVVFAWRR